MTLAIEGAEIMQTQEFIELADMLSKDANAIDLLNNGLVNNCNYDFQKLNYTKEGRTFERIFTVGKYKKKNCYEIGNKNVLLFSEEFRSIIKNEWVEDSVIPTQLY